MAFTIGFVCTGNIHRSPAAESLFLVAVTATTPPILTWSGGTSGLVGVPVDPDTATAVSNYGGDISRHRSKAIEPGAAQRSDLVLCATTAQRAFVLQGSPSAMKRVFTMREFVRLGNALPAPTDIGVARSGPALRQRVAEVGGRRGQAGPIAPQADDIQDPHQQGTEIIRACIAEINRSMARVVHILGCAAPTPISL